MPPVFDSYDAALAHALEQDGDFIVNGVQVGDRRKGRKWRYFIAPARSSDREMWELALSARSGDALSETQRTAVYEMVDKGYLKAELA